VNSDARRCTSFVPPRTDVALVTLFVEAYFSRTMINYRWCVVSADTWWHSKFCLGTYWLRTYARMCLLLAASDESSSFMFGGAPLRRGAQMLNRRVLLAHTAHAPMLTDLLQYYRRVYVPDVQFRTLRRGGWACKMLLLQFKKNEIFVHSVVW